MQVLKLLGRVAFICNISFLLAYLILWLPHPPDGNIVSTVIVMGFLMGLPVNAFVFGWLLVRAIRKRGGTAGVPGWLMFFNLAMFCCQFLSLIQRLT